MRKRDPEVSGKKTLMSPNHKAEAVTSEQRLGWSKGLKLA